MQNNYFPERLKQFFIIFNISLFVLLSPNLFAQCDSVRWSNPKPVGWELLSVKFADVITGYASGNNGTIVKTTNGGSSWTLLKSITSVGLGTIFPVNANVVYASGSNGVIIKSTDGGLNWSLANSGISSTASITLFFVDANIGYAGGSASGTSLLYKTVNGGINWTPISTSFLTASYSYIQALYFTSATTGYVVGEGNVYKTTDGSTFNKLNTNAAHTYSNITFADANTGYIGGNISGLGNTGGLAKTTDGGATWNDLTTNINDFNVFVSAIDFPTSNIGYVLASHKRSYIIKTIDGGATWLPIDSSSGFNSLGDYNDLDFTSATTGVVVGTFGRILPTTDGAHFTDISSNIPRTFLMSVEFPSTDVGYIIHGGVNVSKTSDQGNSWTVINTGSANNLNDIAFTDVNTGYAVGYNGTILKTITGGVAWTPQASPSNHHLNSVQFTNTSIGYAAGDTGTLLKTINGGSSWIALNSGTMDNIKDIFFLDADTGYYISYAFIGNMGPYGSIWKTKNAGANWTKLNFNTQNYLNTIHFPDAMHGYVGANGGLFWKTSDGGVTWQTISSGFSSNFTSIKFSDANTGFATLEKVVYGSSIRTSTGMIIKSIDGGTTWDTLGNKIYPGLTSLTFANSTIGFAVGDESTILKFDLGVSFGEIQGSNAVCTLGTSTYSVNDVSGATYNWSLSGGGTITGSGHTISVNWTSAGSYILSVAPSTTSCGNGNTITLPVTVNSIPKPVLTLSGSQLHSDAANGNTWYLDGQLIANVAGQNYTPTQNGDYTVKVVLNGCNSEFSDPFSICICPSGISAKSKGEQFKIYPNPSHGNFNLEFSKPGNHEVKVINALGEQLWTGSLAETENVINLPEEMRGIYYMQVKSDEGSVMQKILIE